MITKKSANPFWSRTNLGRLYDPLAILAALPLSLVVVVGAILSFRFHTILRQNRDLVVHTYQVIESATQVLVLTADAETGQRGFLIAGDLRFLEPYTRAQQADVPEEVRKLAHLVHDNPDQLKRVDSLQGLLSDKFQELQVTISARRQRGFEASRELVLNQFGKNVMDRIRHSVVDIVQAEQRLLSNRTAEVQKDESHIVWLGILTALGSTTVRMAIAFWRKHLTKTAERLPR